MSKFCIFAGTTEGRRLASFLQSQNAPVTACVATEYGETLLQEGGSLKVLMGRLTEEEMEELFAGEQFDLVIDATHPYARVVTENIRSACQAAGTEYLRLLRESSAMSEEVITVPDTDAAAAFLDKAAGNILLTTGSKELSKFAGIRDFSSRVYARVLPMAASLAACEEAGLKPSRIIAMQGPFSEEMNLQMLEHSKAAWLVTKDGGDAGGFPEKAAAAQKYGAKLLVIGRPAEDEGMDMSSALELLCSRFGFTRRVDVCIAGVGPGSRASMTLEVQKAIEQADCLIGAKRMLEAAAAPGQQVYEAIAPAKIAEFIQEHKELSSFTVVMSGDSGFFSGTKKLLPLLKDWNVTVLPGLSSLSVLCARIGESYEDVKMVSLHGREGNIASVVKKTRRVFALVGGENGVKDLCVSLVKAGLGSVRVTVGERLSYQDEKISRGIAAKMAEGKYDSLSAVLIENDALQMAYPVGIPDELFQRGSGADGVVPMTKSEVRAVAISKLAMTRNAVCWDIGAGTGSVSIELALLADEGHVYAVEKKADAFALLKENIKKFGVGNITALEGSAPAALAELPAPTHVFIGGSSGSIKDIIRSAMEKNPHVRITATAIALETVAELSSCFKEFSFTHKEAVCLNAARSRKAGPYNLMMASNPVYIYTFQKEVREE